MIRIEREIGKERKNRLTTILYYRQIEHTDVKTLLQQQIITAITKI